MAHHVTGNPEEHEFQVLLCGSCHCKVHAEMRPIRKVIDKQVMVDALSKYGLYRAAKVLGVDSRTLVKNMTLVGLFTKLCSVCGTPFEARTWKNTTCKKHYSYKPKTVLLRDKLRDKSRDKSRGD